MVAEPSGPVDSELDKVDLECPICCHDYNWSDKCPRELECLHAFCTECLTKLEGRLPNFSRHIPCPLCRYSTELTASGALDLPRQEQILLALPVQADLCGGGGAAATLSQHVFLTLDSGETTVVMLPTVSLSVEQGEGRRVARRQSLQATSLFRQSQKHQVMNCLRKASLRFSTLIVLACIAAFAFGPRIF